MTDAQLPLSIYEQVPNVKIVFIGDSTVGKSSIINITQNKDLNPEQPSTIGACFYIMKLLVGNIHIKLHIWDTAGQERFRSLTPQYYRDSDYAIIVYSISDPNSFQSVDNWYKSITNSTQKIPKIVILANKADLLKERHISYEKGKFYADSIGASFFEVSAKEKKHEILKLFQKLGDDHVKDLLDKGVINKNNSLKIENNLNKKNCC